MAVGTTGGFTSTQLLAEEQILTLPSLSAVEALEIGEIAKSLGVARNLPIAIEVRLGDWITYHVSLPGSAKRWQSKNLFFDKKLG